MSRSFSRWSHLIRLAVLLVLALTGFVVARTLARPASWNEVVWYRGDALKDIRELPMSYGGNESCDGCHGVKEGITLGPGHLNLSCESCHGALVDHVIEARVVGRAIVVRESPSQCLNCHSEQINRPPDFAQYRYEHGERSVRRHKSERGGRYCIDCHDPHAPELHGAFL